MEKQRWRTDLWTWGQGRRARVRCMGSNMEIYITICKIDSQQEFAVCLRELKHGFCDSLDRWDGEGDGRKLWEGGDMGVPMADSC